MFPKLRSFVLRWSVWIPIASWAELLRATARPCVHLCVCVCVCVCAVVFRKKCRYTDWCPGLLYVRVLQFTSVRSRAGGVCTAHTVWMCFSLNGTFFECQGKRRTHTHTHTHTMRISTQRKIIDCFQVELLCFSSYITSIFSLAPLMSSVFLNLYISIYIWEREREREIEDIFT